tara:strand:+ start:416 stop:1039 length:624 start_codon:yes stop_codon:yes gene_type:complete
MSKYIISPCARSDVDPVKHEYTSPDFRGPIGRSLLTPRMKLYVQGTCLFDLTTPYRAKTEQLTIVLDEETTKSLEDYFSTISTQSASSFVAGGVFKHDFPTEVVRNKFVSPLAKKNGIGALCPTVDPEGVDTSPTIVVASGPNESGDDYVYEEGNVNDLRSVSDGGKGLLPGATVITLLEEMGMWVKRNGSSGMKLRVANLKIIPTL